MYENSTNTDKVALVLIGFLLIMSLLMTVEKVYTISQKASVMEKLVESNRTSDEINKIMKIIEEEFDE